MRRIVELKTILSLDPMKGIKEYEKIVEADDDLEIQSACETIANYIRHSSIYKRRLLFEQLSKCSLLSRMYLAYQFIKFDDTVFPKKLLLEGSSLHEYNDEIINSFNPYHYVTSVGSNRCFNLGLISDGSPIAEPRLVDLPQIIQIEMTNQHTVFLTNDSRIFGCGKSSAIIPDGKIEEGGYQAEPTLIQIPGLDSECHVESIKVSDGGSQFLIDNKWYFIGKIPSNNTNLKRIASNCHVAREESHMEMDELQYQETTVMLDGKRVKIYLTMTEGSLYWDRSPRLEVLKKVDFLINGQEEKTILDQFQVISDGTIYVGISGIMKGKLELWKNMDDGFIVKSGTEKAHFDTKYSLIALLEEIPGTTQVEFFKLSPDGQNLIMESKNRTSYFSRFGHWESRNTRQIIKNRAEKEGDPVDIPLDMIKKSPYSDEEEEEEREPNMNRILYEMIHPTEVHHFPQDHLYDFDNFTSFDMAPTHVFKMPPNTPPGDILNIISEEGETIQCHKYLHLLYSRQINAFQRFESRVYSGFGAIEQEEKPMEIKGMATSQTIRNALNGMVNVKNLTEIKTIELIECINYYDYHMMDELFRDSMIILMETTNEFNVSNLFTLFHSFPEAIIDGLVRRPGLVFYSKEQPPKELLVQFAKKFEEFRKDNKPPEKIRLPVMQDIFALPDEVAAIIESFSSRPQPLTHYEPEYVIKSLLNLDEDSEDVVWNSLRNEIGNSVDEWHLKKKEEKKRTRMSSSKGSHEFSMASSPIPIGRPKTDSFSVQSPTSYSISPRTKAPLRPSYEDFPEMGSPAPSTSSPKPKFSSKGAKFKKDFEILKTPPTLNPWKLGGASETPRFVEVVEEEIILQENIETGNRKVQCLAHVETEQLAATEILNQFKESYGDEALVGVELVSDDRYAQNERFQWGSMPGLIRR